MTMTIIIINKCMCFESFMWKGLDSEKSNSTVWRITMGQACSEVCLFIFNCASFNTHHHSSVLKLILFQEET